MTYPNVSIIIPVLNQKDNLQECLDRIFDQDYPQEKMEVIVIDNGSGDGSWELLDSYSLIKYRKDHIKSPYVCRNYGVARSTGDVLVFSDARMVPGGKEWLASGVDCLLNNSADIAMGRIKVVPDEMNSLSNWCEAIDMLRFNIFALENKAFLFNNTFIQKDRFLKIGYFDETRSGSDALWASLALERRYNIDLCTSAVSTYRTKSFKSLQKKYVRTGYYSFKRQQVKNQGWVSFGFFKLLDARPPNPFFISKIWVSECLPKKSPFWFLRLFFLLWYFRCIKVLAALGLPITQPD